MSDPVQEYNYGCPTTVGICAVCNKDIDDYELSEEGCECCVASRHKSCMAACAACGHIGCKSCLKADDGTGEYLCDKEDCRVVFRLRIEKEEWEGWQRDLETIRKGIAKEMDLVAKEIDEINQQLKEYE